MATQTNPTNPIPEGLLPTTPLNPDKLLEILQTMSQMKTLGQIQDYLKTLLPKQAAATAQAPGKPPIPLKPPIPQPAQPTVKPELVIKRTEFPKWWSNLTTAKIDISSQGSQILIPWRSGHFSYLVSMVFVCDGETDLSLRLASTPITGPMSFGGSDEPRGMTINFGEGPIPCGDQILYLFSDPPTPPVQVSGLAVYYTEPSDKALK